MKELISVVVPIYNVEKYLSRCVESILNQTYKNLEIILVDDGSPDACPQICNEFQEKDPRIRVIHQENAGLSAARNTGIKYATGAYIAFVDSDDYIDENMYEVMYEDIQKNVADLCICDICCVNEAGEKIREENIESLFANKVYTSEEMMKRVCGIESSTWRYTPAWNKLYKKEVFDSYQFVAGKIHEDEFAIHHTIHNCEKISVVPDKLYYYVQRENSIMNSSFSIKKFDAALAFWDRYIFVKKYYADAIAKGALMQLYANLVVNLCKYNTIEYREAISPIVKNTVWALMQNKDFRFGKLCLVYLKSLVKSLKM